MGSQNIHSSRIALLNHKPVIDGDYVLYWMQQSQRTRYNHALEYAIQQANEYWLKPQIAGSCKLNPTLSFRLQLRRRKRNGQPAPFGQSCKNMPKNI